MRTKKIKLPYGIPDYNLTEIEREVSVDEPSAWPVNKDLKVVGKRIKRNDALEKVTGSGIYTADVHLPGMLYGKMLRSIYPHARIKSIDITEAKNYPGVFAVHIIENMVEGANPVDAGNNSKYPEIRYLGQPILGVAATSINVAEEALNLIKIDYDSLDYVVDIDDALKPGAPLVYKTDVNQKASSGGEDIEEGLSSKGNVRGPSTGSFYGGPRGDLNKGFKESDIIIDRTYRTQVQRTVRWRHTVWLLTITLEMQRFMLLRNQPKTSVTNLPKFLNSRKVKSG